MMILCKIKYFDAKFANILSTSLNFVNKKLAPLCVLLIKVCILFITLEILRNFL